MILGYYNRYLKILSNKFMIINNHNNIIKLYNDKIIYILYRKNNKKFITLFYDYFNNDLYCYNNLTKCNKMDKIRYNIFEYKYERLIIMLYKNNFHIIIY